MQNVYVHRPFLETYNLEDGATSDGITNIVTSNRFSYISPVTKFINYEQIIEAMVNGTFMEREGKEFSPSITKSRLKNKITSSLHTLT